MKLFDKLRRLRITYIKEMSNKALMEVDDVDRMYEDPKLRERFINLPTIYEELAESRARVYQVIAYKNEKVICYCEEDEVWDTFNVRTFPWMFPLEVLVEINEY